jgi:zinc transport system permease protein
MSDALLAQGLWQRIAENTFYQYALAGGAGLALVCGLLSVFVVLKRMSFIGEGIAHGAFGGVGIALLAGLFVAEIRPPLARDGVVAVFCVATAVAIGYLSRRGRLTEDTAIGICLVAAMALGVLLLDVRAHWLEGLIASGRVDRGSVGYTPQLHDLLFGDILMLGWPEVIVNCGLALAVTLGVLMFFKELVFFIFDEETAEVFGIRTGLLYYGLLVALGLAVAATMRSLGVILVSALLILPGASARYWSNRIGRVTVISAVLAVAGLVAGLLLSIYLRYVSPAAVIVLTLTAIFIFSYVVNALRRR